MAWELIWTTKPRDHPSQEEAIAPTETPKDQTHNVSQNQNLYRLAPVQRHTKVRPPSSQVKRKPLPSSYKPTRASHTREVRRPKSRTYHNLNAVSGSKSPLRTDSYFISSTPNNEIVQNASAETREGVSRSYHHQNSYCKQCSLPLNDPFLDNIIATFTPVLAALDSTADDHNHGHQDFSLPQIPTTPLEFAQFPYSRKGSFDTSMMTLIQTHPDTPIGGYEAAPMAIIYPVSSRRVVDERRRYETPRIEISPPETTYNPGRREQLRSSSSSSYEYQTYEALVDGNISHSQSSQSSSGNTYCCSLGKQEKPVPPIDRRDSCFAAECPTHVEKWISDVDNNGPPIPATDGANTPPLTSASDPPITAIHHDTTPPTAPLPIPVETPAAPEPELPEPSKVDQATAKAKKALAKKRKAKQGLRKFRKVIFRKTVLKVVLGRQLAQPTADLLKLVAEGVPFDPPDVMALAKPPVDAPVPVDAVPTDAVPTGALPAGALPV
ncbi:hypothetical protein HYALB_00004805 [Hymenoscyphus albidus]|uniref:Uncharacterized protein n=1 Tax=Hymenoscyphus albidus TaxID=595503 RepID=A0A9N9LQ03_9HELO|nr:hypothetical protein HYALB_00004805 [Hymenoscyphus albidus]